MVGLSGHMHGDALDRLLRKLRNVEPLHGGLSEAFDPDFARLVDADFDHVRVL